MFGKEQNESESERRLGTPEVGDRAGAAADGRALAPDLRALEAALGALVPRADRLDRDQLLFLAGQASASRHAGTRWTTRVVHAWAVAMTAAAAVLGVLLAQAERRWESGPERFALQAGLSRQDAPSPPDRAHLAERRLTHRRAGQAGVLSPGRAEALSQRPAEPTQARQRPEARLSAQTGRLADWARFGSRAEYQRWVARLLGHDIDPWPSSDFVPGATYRRNEKAVSYYKRLKELLDEQVRAASAGEGGFSTARKGTAS